MEAFLKILEVVLAGLVKLLEGRGMSPEDARAEAMEYARKSLPKVLTDAQRDELREIVNGGLDDVADS
jgi:hypothetical protein